MQNKAQISILDPTPQDSQALIDHLHDQKVVLSLEIIESHLILVREPSLNRYSWNFHHVQQWHSVAYVLEEIARRPDASFASRLWQVIDLVFSEPHVLDKHGTTHETREQMLTAHGKALQARERMLQQRPVSISSLLKPPLNRLQQMDESDRKMTEKSNLSTLQARIEERNDTAEKMFWPSTD